MVFCFSEAGCAYEDGATLAKTLKDRLRFKKAVNLIRRSLHAFRKLCKGGWIFCGSARNFKGDYNLKDATLLHDQLYFNSRY